MKSHNAHGSVNTAVVVEWLAAKRFQSIHKFLFFSFLYPFIFIVTPPDHRAGSARATQTNNKYARLNVSTGWYVLDYYNNNNTFHIIFYSLTVEKKNKKNTSVCNIIISRYPGAVRKWRRTRNLSDFNT